MKYEVNSKGHCCWIAFSVNTRLTAKDVFLSMSLNLFVYDIVFVLFLASLHCYTYIYIYLFTTAYTYVVFVRHFNVYLNTFVLAYFKK